MEVEEGLKINRVGRVKRGGGRRMFRLEIEKKRGGVTSR